MSTHEAKALLQQEILIAYIQTAKTRYPYRLAIYSSTGSGKSKASIECALWYQQHKASLCNDGILIICHSETSRDEQWPEEVAKWDTDKRLPRLTTICYQSLHTLKGKHYSMIIADEAHKFTPNHESFFTDNRFESLILLTATMPRDRHKRVLLHRQVGKNVFRLKVDAAIDKGITNDYRINLFLLDFDETLPYIPISTNGTTVIMTERQAYTYHCNQIRNAIGQPSRSKFATIALMRFMAMTKSKEDLTRYMMARMREKNRRFLVFANSIVQCNRLSPYVMHSEVDDRHYRAFKEGRISELVTIRQIQEGANIPALDKAICIQLDRNPLNIIQKTGRLLRNEKEVISDINIPIFEKTIDDDIARKALAHFDPNKIVRYRLDKNKYWI